MLMIVLVVVLLAGLLLVAQAFLNERKAEKEAAIMPNLFLPTGPQFSSPGPIEIKMPSVEKKLPSPGIKLSSPKEAAPSPFGKLFSLPAVPAASKPRPVSPKEELQDIKDALVHKLDEKCVKLEQILEEKNRILSRLEGDLKNEQGHRNEFESLKSILEQQIDELKLQNRKLKEEIGKVLQENLAMQTKVCDLERAARGERQAPVVSAEPLAAPPQPPAQGFDKFFQADQGVKPLSLNDVFNKDNENK